MPYSRGGRSEAQHNIHIYICTSQSICGPCTITTRRQSIHNPCTICKSCMSTFACHHCIINALAIHSPRYYIHPYIVATSRTCRQYISQERQPDTLRTQPKHNPYTDHPQPVHNPYIAQTSSTHNPYPVQEQPIQTPQVIHRRMMGNLSIIHPNPIQSPHTSNT